MMEICPTCQNKGYYYEKGDPCGIYDGEGKLNIVKGDKKEFCGCLIGRNKLILDFIHGYNQLWNWYKEKETKIKELIKTRDELRDKIKELEKKINE